MVGMAAREPGEKILGSRLFTSGYCELLLCKLLPVLAMRAFQHRYVREPPINIRRLPRDDCRAAAVRLCSVIGHFYMHKSVRRVQVAVFRSPGCCSLRFCNSLHREATVRPVILPRSACRQLEPVRPVLGATRIYIAPSSNSRAILKSKVSENHPPKSHQHHSRSLKSLLGILATDELLLILRPIHPIIDKHL